MKSVISLILFCFFAPLSFAAANATWQPWRTARNQGVNALFCYLRVHDVACEYIDLVKEQALEIGSGSYSAKALVHLAAKHGVVLRVTSLTMEEFKSCERPVIAYMTSNTPDDGAFVLVMNSTDTDVFYVDGATAAIQSMSVEDFRRTWSGIALLKADGRTANALLFGLGFGIAFALPAGILWGLSKK